MKTRHIGPVLVLAAIVFLYAPAAEAVCRTCHVEDKVVVVNGNSYWYLTGYCKNPGSNSWGWENCHSATHVIQIEGEAVEALLYCNTYGYQCYYTEVGGGGGGDDGDCTGREVGGGDDPVAGLYGGCGGGGGGCTRDSSGYCPASCSSCS